jgi:hypothetical protein
VLREAVCTAVHTSCKQQLGKHSEASSAFLRVLEPVQTEPKAMLSAKEEQTLWRRAHQIGTERASDTAMDRCSIRVSRAACCLCTPVDHLAGMLVHAKTVSTAQKYQR